MTPYGPVTVLALRLNNDDTVVVRTFMGQYRLASAPTDLDGVR
jgi:hypothetical protein